MKKRGKKLLAGAAALAMSCSMVTGWANGVEIVDVKVLNSASDEGTSFTKNSETGKFEGSLTADQMLKVTVKLTDDSAAIAAGDVTFLSNIANAETLNNDSIQYVDQQTVSTEKGEATITFRPRMTIGDVGKGAFIAKAGGTDVATTAEFNYTVVAPSVPLSASIGGTITEGNDAVINLSVPDGKDMPTAVTVKDGETVLETGISYDSTVKTLTVSNLKPGTHNLTISADGYVSTSVQVVVESAEVIVDSGDTGSVTTGIQDKLAGMTPSNGSVKLPTGTVTGGGTNTNYNVSYTVTTPDESKIVRGADGTISLATVGEGENAKKVFAAKITVTASVGTTNPITSNKDIYLVADPDVNVSFGNINLISTSTGADAFLSDTNFSDAKEAAGDSFEATKVAIQTEVLNYALERRSPSELDNVVKPTVDYDLNGKVTLSEYRMLKLMLEGSNANFTPSKLDTARAGWINQANPNSAE